MDSEHCQTFKMTDFAKTIMLECNHIARNFSGLERDFVELGKFDKHFTKNTKKGVQENFIEVFS